MEEGEMTSHDPDNGWSNLIPKAPGLIAGFLGFVTVVVGVVQLWESRPDLVTRVVVVSILGAVWLGCVYLVTQRASRWRSMGIVGAVVLPLALVGAIVWSGSLVSTPSQTGATASGPSQAPAPQTLSAEAKTRLAPLDEAIKNNPQSAEAYARRGTVYYELNRSDDAIRDLNQAIKLDPGYAGAYFILGAVYYYQKADFDRSIENFNKLLELQPGHVNGYSGRGQAHARKGDVDKAIADFTTHINLSEDIRVKPNVASVYLARAQAYQRKGDKDKAIADYKTILDAVKEGDFRLQAEQQLKALGAQ